MATGSPSVVGCEPSTRSPDVLVTASDAEIAIVVGLDAGASDYVTKPFSLNVLLARVRAHLRFLDRVDSDAALELGALTVNPSAYEVTVNGEPVELRPREFELLVILARECGRVITRERLLAEVWDMNWETSTKTLEMHVGAAPQAGYRDRHRHHSRGRLSPVRG